MRFGDSNTVPNLLNQWIAFIRAYLDTIQKTLTLYLKPWLGTFYLQMQYSCRQFSCNSVVEFWSTKPEIVKDYLSYTELKPHWVVDRDILTHIFKIVIALQ